MKLTFMEQPPLHPELLVCPHCQESGRIGIHSQAEQRCICHACKRTFAETKGTPLHDLKYPLELCVNTQHGKVWMATAMSVFARLFLWGEVGQHRDTALLDQLFAHVRRAANGLQPVLVAVDGFAAYPKVIRKHFATVVRSGKVGRPAHRPGRQAAHWPPAQGHQAPRGVWLPPAR
jgi:hypothetical protein